jgi:hypothetical protein
MLREHLLAKLRGRSIDARLLAGESSGASEVTKARRDMLLDPHYRAAVAEALRRMVDAAAAGGRYPFSSRLHLRLREVREASPLMLQLADEVEGDPSVEIRGVILADRLIRDGDSPVYWPCDDSVETAVRHARAALHLG